MEGDEIIDQIKYVSYKDLLELDNVSKFNNIRVHNKNKILNISLN